MKLAKEDLKKIKESLWKGAIRLRVGLGGTHTCAEICLNLIFLKYISEKFDKLKKEFKEESKRIPEQLAQDEDYLRNWYVSHNALYLSEETHWDYINKNRDKQNIKQILDNVFAKLKEESKRLKTIFSPVFSRMEVKPESVAKLIDIFANQMPNLNNNHDTIGQIYEYFLQRFALASGRKSGEFYTPACVVKLLVALLKPEKGRVYDPCCGTGGMFIQSSKFSKNLAIFGQEKETAVWRWCQLNSFIHGLEYDLGDRAENTFLNDLHTDTKVDYILCNPPFNLEEWNEGEKVDEERWIYGTPPSSNANYAWIQHIINKLQWKGIAGIILANGSLSAKNQEKIIRQNILEANLVEGIIQLPNKLFYTTQISAVIWIIRKNRKTKKIFFFNAKDFEGEMLDRKWREFTQQEINLIASEYKEWLKNDEHYTEGIGASIDISEIKEKDWLLLPSLYVKKKKVKINEEEINREIKAICTEVVNILEELETEKTKIVDLLNNVVKKENPN